MSIWKKSFLFVAYLPMRFRSAFAEYRSKRVCIAKGSARLLLTSRIDNIQRLKSAILIGDHSIVAGQLLVFRHAGQITIGTHCYIGEDSRIWSAKSVTIGNRVLISHGVNIHDNNSHSLSAKNRHRHFLDIFSTGHPDVLEDVLSAPVVIGDDVWVGFNSAILKGVTVGKGAVVAACSVVTKDVLAWTVVAGNPARVIKTIPEDQR